MKAFEHFPSVIRVRVIVMSASYALTKASFTVWAVVSVYTHSPLGRHWWLVRVVETDRPGPRRYAPPSCMLFVVFSCIFFVFEMHRFGFDGAWLLDTPQWKGLLAALRHHKLSPDGTSKPQRVHGQHKGLLARVGRRGLVYRSRLGRRVVRVVEHARTTGAKRGRGPEAMHFTRKPKEPKAVVLVQPLVENGA